MRGREGGWSKAVWNFSKNSSDLVAGSFPKLGQSQDLVLSQVTIISTALPFCLAGVLVSQATTVQVICLGRALAGLCIGAMSLSLPVYLAECLRPEVRGRLGLLPTTLGNLGVLICFICGAWLDWAEVKFVHLPEV